jgi:hypothetical protein
MGVKITCQFSLDRALVFQTEQEIPKHYLIQLKIPLQVPDGSGINLRLKENVRAFSPLANRVSQRTSSPDVNRRHFAAAGRYILAYFVDSLGDVCLLHLGVEDESKFIAPHAKNLLSMGLPLVYAGSRKNEGQRILAPVWQKLTISQRGCSRKLTRLKP